MKTEHFNCDLLVLCSGRIKRCFHKNFNRKYYTEILNTKLDDDLYNIKIILGNICIN